MKIITIIAIAAAAFLLGAFMGVLLMGLCIASSDDDRETERREELNSGKR